VILAGATAIGGNPQNQGSAQGGTQTGGATSAASQVASVLGMISQAIQPLLLPSFRALNWFIDNLVQKGQADTSDILPLGKGDMASVAVILPVSSMLDPTEGDADPSVTARFEDRDPAGPAAEMPRPDEREPAPPSSTLERFLFHPDGSFAGLSMDVGQAASLRTGLGADWVWRQQGAGTPGVPAAATVHPTINAAGPRLCHPASRSIPETDAPGDVESTAPIRTVGQDAQPDASAEMELPSTYRVTIQVVLIVLSTVLLAGTRYGKKIWSNLKSRVRRLRLAGVTPPERKATGQGKSLRPQPRSSQDLPPWIQCSVAKRSRSKSLYETLALSRKSSSR
jgi:hypothetical protein